MSEKNFSYVGVGVVSALLFLFIIGVSLAVWFKSRKKKKKPGQEPDTDSDSFEEDDDIVVENPKPKNPFTFKKQVDKNGREDDFKNERYKYFNGKLPQHAKAMVKHQEPPPGAEPG